jgi:hypothetical protein
MVESYVAHADEPKWIRDEVIPAKSWGVTGALNAQRIGAAVGLTGADGAAREAP